MEKMCKKCKVVKTVDCFVKNKNCKDGHEGMCKECKNETRRLRYEKLLKHRTFPAESVNKRVYGNSFGKVGLTGQDIKSHYDLQDKKCIYCSVELFDNFHVDHKVPISLGGENTISNICIACPDCNRLKHTRNHDEFIQFLKQYTSRFIV